MKRYRHKEYLMNVLPCAGYGILCGALTGGMIFLFRLVAKYLENLSRLLYGMAKEAWWSVGLVFAALLVFAVAMLLLHHKIPEVQGGGIPRSEGILRGALSFRGLKTLFGTWLGSMMSFLCGLPLGSEGPAVLIGTAMGSLCVGRSGRYSAWSRYVMSGGAGAGFAVATGAPLSGMLFVWEEIHKRFTPMLVMTVSLSVLSGTYVNRLLCALFDVDAQLFSLEPLAEFQLSHVGYLLLLGLLVALAVGLFDASIARFRSLTKRFAKIFTKPVKLITVFLLVGICGFVFSEGIYSGHHMIVEILTDTKTVGFLLLLFIMRLLMMLLMTDSGATGGIFIPTLAIGAVLGALVAKLLVVIGMPEELFGTAVMLGMCAFLGGTLRAPLTACVLFVELTGQLVGLFYVAIAVFTVNLIVSLLNQKPFYDCVLDDMEKVQNADKHPQLAYFEMKVSRGAFVIGKTVRDIMWPSSSVVVSVKRKDRQVQDMDHDGEKKLYEGDTVCLRAKFYDEDEIRQLLGGLVGTDEEIRRLERL